MSVFLQVDDLRLFSTLSVDQLRIIIADLEAAAVASAPCLGSPDGLTSSQFAAAVAILRSAALRWTERQEGGDRQLVAGPFSYGPAQGASSETRRPLLWPSELQALQRLCSQQPRRGAVMGWLA